MQGTLRKAFSDLYTLSISAKGAWDDIYYKSSWGDSEYDFTDLQLNSSHTFRLTDWWGVSLAADIERGTLKSPGLYDAARTAVISALATAIRLERFQADLALEYRGTFDKGAEGLNSLSPSVDLRFTLFEGFDLVGFARRAFRAPTFNELYYPGYGNPNLKPEDAWLFDLGFDWHPELSEDWTLGLKVDGYCNKLKDKIISAGAVLKGAVDPADGGAGGTGFSQNFVIDLPIVKPSGNLEALLHGGKLAHCAEILKKIEAFLLRTEGEDGLVKAVVMPALCPCIHRHLR